MDTNNEKSELIQNINKGLAASIFSFNGDQSKITYHCARDYTVSFKNPEERVRASYFSELVLIFQYPAKKINLEVLVPRRTPEDRADIVIYEDEELKSPFLVVECKKEGITDAEYKQAIEQTFGNANSIRAKYAAVVAGNTRTAFDIAGFKPNEREKNVISDIPIKYGKAPKYKFIKGDDLKDLKIVSRDDLISALEKCHDTVWQGGKLAPTTAFDEVSKLLFCKMKDEKDGTKKGQHYRFQCGTHETAEEVSKRINEIYQDAKKQDEEVFKEDIRLEPKVIYSVVEHLQRLSLNKTDLDTKGVAFEKFMVDYFKGKMGQFFTPRPIIDFAVKMLEPTHDDLVIDPSCGSGGFLLSVLDIVRHNAEADYDDHDSYEIWHNFAKKNLHGIEINDQIARICKMNMIIHDDGHTNVINADSLNFLRIIKEQHKGFTKDRFSLLLANPPFGAIVKSTERENKYLEQYKLGEGRLNQKTEILFIERCIDFLKPGEGRMALVLPDGILTNSSLQYVRDVLLERCIVTAIVSLPQFAFNHFGAGVKSSLVFARKKSKGEMIENYPIFMAIADKIGYEATGSDDENHLLLLVSEYKNMLANPRTYKEYEFKQTRAFKLQFKELDSRMDPLFYIQDIFSFLKNGPFESRPIGELVSYIRSGFAAGKKEQEKDEYEGIIQLRPTNINEEGNLYFDKEVRLKEEYSIKKKDDLLKKEEVLFNNTNSQELVGKTAFFNLEGQYFCSNHITRIATKKSLINPMYLWLVLNTYQREKIFFKICTNWNNQSGINVELLKSVKVPLPPLEIQQKIVNSYIKNQEEIEQLKTQISILLNSSKEDLIKYILNK